VSDELVQPDLSQRAHLMGVLAEALDSWDAVREVCGPEVAGDPIADMATAALLSGYRRVTLTEDGGA
jgi:hypothetical protein